MKPIVNNTENLVDWDSSSSGDAFTVWGVSRLTRVSKGSGLLYFWTGSQSWGSGVQFVLKNNSIADYSIPEPGKVSVSLDALTRFPCVGFISGMQEGYLIAPAIQLAIPGGRDVILMIFSPHDIPRSLSANKTGLTIPGEGAEVTLSIENGVLRCLGAISGKGFKTARLVLNRNPGLPIYSSGFNATLCELREPGEVNTVWSPVSRNFESCLFVIHPPSGSSDFGRPLRPSIGELGAHLGAPEDDFTGKTPDYVVGDGVGVSYSIRLLLDRGLGRHSSDEALLELT